MLERKIFDTDPIIADHLGERVLDIPTRVNILNSAVIRRGIAAALHHYNSNADNSGALDGFGFEPVDLKMLHEIGIPDPERHMDSGAKWIKGRSALKDKSIIALVYQHGNGTIDVLHNAYVFTEKEKIVKPFDLEMFINVFQIPEGERANISAASLGRRVHYERSKKRVRSADTVIFSRLLEEQRQDIGFIFAHLLETDGPLATAAFAQSLNRGRHPENTLVGYAHLMDVPRRFSTDEGISIVDIPILELEQSETSSHFSVDGQETLLAPSGKIRVPIHPVLYKSLGLVGSNENICGVFHSYPTGGMRTLFIAKSTLPDNAGQGDIVKTAVPARVSNVQRAIPPDELFHSRAASAIFAENIARRGPPDGILYLLDAESVEVFRDGTYVAALMRRWPKLQNDEFPIPGFSLYTLLPEEYGNKPLLVQVLNSMLTERDIDTLAIPEEVLSLTKELIIDPVVKGLDWLYGCKGVYKDSRTGKTFSMEGASHETHAQNVEWIVRVQGGYLTLQPKVIFKDFATSLLPAETPQLKRIEKVARQWDVRLGCFLMEPIFQVLASYYQISAAALRQLLIESFKKHITHKELFVYEGHVQHHHVNDVFTRTFHMNAEVPSASSLLTWPPLYRPARIEDYLC